MASALRRYAGYGPLGPGGLYQWNRATNTTSPLVDVRTLGIDVGSIPSNAARGLTATLVVNKAGETHNFERDSVESEVGKVGIGDLESSDDGNILYFTNLHKRTLHSYNLLTGAATTFTLPYSDTAPLPSATCTNGVARPWATKFKEGKVYVGVVCDASLSPGLSAGQGYSATAVDLLAAKSNLRAKVFALDIASGNFDPAPIFDFPLTYPKASHMVALITRANMASGRGRIACHNWLSCTSLKCMAQPMAMQISISGRSLSSMTLNSMWMARW